MERPGFPRRARADRDPRHRRRGQQASAAAADDAAADAGRILMAPIVMQVMMRMRTTLLTPVRARLTFTVFLAGTAAALVAAQGTSSFQSRDVQKAPLAPGRGSIAGTVMSD